MVGQSAGSTSHVVALDGLRFFAFLAVFIYHAFQKNVRVDWIVQYGALGVQVFFVLSGFLIGGALLEVRRSMAATDGIGVPLRRFYARRALRIFPLYYATLALLLLLELAGETAVGGREVLPWNLTYLTNVQWFVDGETVGGLAHLWSLSVEEHFYLIAPLLVLTLTVRQLSWVCVGTWVGAGAGRVALWSTGEEDAWLLSPFQFDCMTVGVALAIVHLDGSFLGISRRTVTAVCGWAAVVSVPVLLLRQFDGLLITELGTQGLENLAISLASGWLILHLWTSAATRPTRLLSLRPFPYLGKISYGLYIFHLPCLVLASAWFAFMPVGTAVPAFAMTLALAALSWRLMEAPINAQKRRFPMLPARTSARQGMSFGTPRGVVPAPADASATRGGTSSPSG